MNYLQLTNRLIQESGAELNELDPTSWNLPDAGRRQYPRFKRYIAQAWVDIQMKREQWEFNSAKINTVVYPRLRFDGGVGVSGPVAGDIFVGVASEAILVIRSVSLEGGDWGAGTAFGEIEFTVQDPQPRTIPMNDRFEDLVSTTAFNYTDRGSYNFGWTPDDAGEIMPTTVTVSKFENNYPIVARYIPWDSYVYQQYNYGGGYLAPPAYFSFDYKGNMVFLNQSYEPFRLSFVYSPAPQELVLPVDVPARIPTAYHMWIVWEALLMLALYDKNPQLAQHADKHAQPFRLRAERNLMPRMSWRGSEYNE